MVVVAGQPFEPTLIFYPKPSPTVNPRPYPSPAKGSYARAAT